MNKFNFLAVAVAAVSLAGCTGSGGGAGGGGGGGGGGGPVSTSDYDMRLSQIQNMVPTSDMPTSLNATYTGATKQELRETSGGAVVGEMMADLELTADWTDGQMTNPWTGRAHNFRGTLNGNDYTQDGELTVANAEAASLTSTIGRTANTINLPIGGTQTVATGAASVSLMGDVDDGSGTTHQVLMTLGGAFMGSGGQAITGPALTQGFHSGGLRSELVSAGDYYVSQ